MLEVSPPAQAACIFAAMGDPTRLSLLMRLSDGGERSIAMLSADGTMTRQAVSKHLQVLEGAGLVRSARVGRESRYTFQPEQVAAARGFLDAVSAQWDDALQRLKSFVET